MSKVRTSAGWLAQVLCWVLLLASVLVLVSAVLVPRLTGSTPYTIATGSMEPTMPPGTLVVVKPADTDKLQAGDVITYQLKSGEAEVVTHRIIGLGTSLEGETFFRTQGDANNTADKLLVKPVQVRGEAWYKLPFVGYVAQGLTSDQRYITNYVLAGLLTAYALWQFLCFYRERRKPKDVVSKETAPRRRRPAVNAPALLSLGIVMGALVAGLSLPSGAYWSTARQTVGTTVTSGDPFYCRVVNSNNGSPLAGATCTISLGTLGCPTASPGTSHVYFNVTVTGMNGQGNNREIQYRTSLRGMGCNPVGMNWSSGTAGIQVTPPNTLVPGFACSTLPLIEGTIPAGSQGNNVLVGTVYNNRGARPVSCV